MSTIERFRCSGVKAWVALAMLVSACGPGQTDTPPDPSESPGASNAPGGSGSSGEREGLLASGGVACAMVYADDGSLDRPVTATCAPGDRMQPCNTWLPVVPRCEVESDRWYQDAIDFAADRDADGVPRRSGRPLYHRVYFSPGTIAITSPLPAAWPYGPFIGLHVPGGVNVSGAPRTLNVGETVLRPADCMRHPTENRCLESTGAERLGALALIAERRMPGAGEDFLRQPAAEDGSLSNLVLVGTPGALPPPATCAGRTDDAQIHTNRGIAGGPTAGGFTLESLSVISTLGNGIDLGALVQWAPEDPANAQNPACGQTGYCRALLHRFSGAPGRENRVRWNYLCDTHFGGITVVGDHVDVTENTVFVPDQTWTATRAFGTTMAVSASFAGSGYNRIIGNHLHGADYGIGTDGSYPLYVTIPLFQNHWSEIVASQPPDFAARYPAGCPVDGNGQLAFKSTDDFLRAQQVLFDLASAAHSASSDPAVYDGGFGTDLQLSGNVIDGAVAGISLWRMKRTWVENNQLSGAGSANRAVGILIAQSHDTFTYGNQIGDYTRGINVTGRPGSASRLGASFNGVGVKFDEATGSYFDVGNTITNVGSGVVLLDAGWDNAVRKNVITGATGSACDFSGAERMAQGPDWTTFNTPESCNADY